jgi:ribonuclease R
LQVPGRFQPHPRGFGFVDPEDRSADEEVEQGDGPGSVFVPPTVARGWLADDLVVAEVETDERGRRSAASLTLRSRSRRFVVGTLATFAGKTVLRPDPKLGTGQVDLSPELSQQVQRADGRQIVAMITDAGDGSPVASALVAGPEPLSAPTALRARAVVLAHGAASPETIPGGPEAIGLPAAETIGYALRALGHLASGRPGLAAGMSAEVGPVPGVEMVLHDRRTATVVTIDDDSARDLDDALGASWSGRPDDPVQLTVHIADASGTVGIGSPADHYAATMATSAYFVAGPNAPMLDPALSEDELSLLPTSTRRVVTVRMAVSPDGTTSDVRIDTSWIEPDARLSYAAVDTYLDDGDPTSLAQGVIGPHGAAPERLGAVTETVDALIEATRRLGVERDERDTLEWLFEPATLEATTIDGRIRAVEADPHPRAQRLVERAMVATNEAVAAWAEARGLPLLYRGHIGFAPDRLHRLHAAARAIGVQLGSGEETAEAATDPAPSDVLRVINELRAAGRHEDATVLATAAAGVVARASYSAEPTGHGALASGVYTHFTSPIRRYADLVVHRQIRASLAGEPLPYDRDLLARLAPWLDARAGAAGYAEVLERNALWAILLERGAVPWPTEAVVTGVSAAGLRVRLVAPGLSGFVPAAAAMGRPPKEKASLTLDEHGLGTADGRFRLGTRLKVRLHRVDPVGRPELVPADG